MEDDNEQGTTCMYAQKRVHLSTFSSARIPAVCILGICFCGNNKEVGEMEGCGRECFESWDCEADVMGILDHT